MNWRISCSCKVCLMLLAHKPIKPGTASLTLYWTKSNCLTKEILFCQVPPVANSMKGFKKWKHMTMLNITIQASKTFIELATVGIIFFSSNHRLPAIRRRQPGSDSAGRADSGRSAAAADAALHPRPPTENEVRVVLFWSWINKCRPILVQGLRRDFWKK